MSECDGDFLASENGNTVGHRPKQPRAMRMKFLAALGIMVTAERTEARSRRETRDPPGKQASSTVRQKGETQNNQPRINRERERNGADGAAATEATIPAGGESDIKKLL